MNDPTLTGGCSCGHIRFEVAGPIRFCCFCHCESCRTAAGGAFVPWATFDKSTFNITSGRMTLHRSTPGVTRGHCSQCGTSLTYEHEDRVGQIDITPSSFDDPSLFSPAAHIWVEDKLPWISIDDSLPQYARTVVPA